MKEWEIPSGTCEPDDIIAQTFKLEIMNKVENSSDFTEEEDHELETLFSQRKMVYIIF